MPRAASGFTLVELMVVLAVVGIVTAMATPAVSDMVAGRRLDTAGGQLAGAVRYARSEAIKRSGVVIVEPVAPNDWAGSLRVYVDADGNTANGFQAADTLVRLFGANQALKVIAGSPARIALDAQGRGLSLGANPILADATVTFCVNAQRRAVRVERSGMAVASSSAGAC